MRLGYHVNKDIQGKRLFWIGPPALCDLSQTLSRHGALRALRSKWQTTLKMLQAHTPELILLYFRHADGALTHEHVLALEDLLQVNVQLVDTLEAFDHPGYVKSTGAFSPTVYVWAGSMAPLDLMQPGEAATHDASSGWASFIDDGGLLADYPSMTVGMLLMEDAMMSTLVLHKHLQHITSGRRSPGKPKLVLALGKIVGDEQRTQLQTVICELAQNNHIALVIATDDAMEIVEEMQDNAEHVRVLNIADELDPFSVSLIWKNIKTQARPGNCSCLFLGQWSFDARRNPSKTIGEFQRLEKETKMALVYDVWSWWTLHPGAKLAEDLSVTANPAFLLQSFGKGGDAELSLEMIDPKDPSGAGGGAGAGGGGGCGGCSGDDDGEAMETCVQQ